jgi:hypothetical protein
MAPKWHLKLLLVEVFRPQSMGSGHKMYDEVASPTSPSTPKVANLVSNISHRRDMLYGGTPGRIWRLLENSKSGGKRGF